MTKSDIGLIGLAVMGQNLVLNMADNGYRVTVFNRTVSKVDEFLETTAKGKTVVGAHSLQELVDSLQRPRRVMLMIKAGNPVDDYIDMLVPLLEEGDVIIDGGNSNFEDFDPQDRVRRVSRAAVHRHGYIWRRGRCALTVLPSCPEVRRMPGCM